MARRGRLTKGNTAPSLSFSCFPGPEDAKSASSNGGVQGILSTSSPWKRKDGRGFAPRALKRE